VRIANNQATLGKVAVLPAIMFLCYVGLILYFKSRGGYQQVHVENLGVCDAEAPADLFSAARRISFGVRLETRKVDASSASANAGGCDGWRPLFPGGNGGVGRLSRRIRVVVAGPVSGASRGAARSCRLSGITISSFAMRRCATYGRPRRW
jgi:hypothetical protein